MNQKIVVAAAVILVALAFLGLVYAVSIITYAPSAPVTITVNPSPTPPPTQVSGAIAVTPSATTLTNGQDVVLTITLNPATSGTVITVYDGGTIIGTTPTDATGIATLTLSSLAVGQHVITAQAPQVTVP